MTTVHAFTGDQNTVDTIHKDLRRARAASLSMIPTSTGAAKAIGLVLPKLAGKLDGSAIRVPTPNVSMIDLVFMPKKATTAAKINAAMRRAANGSLKNILDVCDEPLVSSDFNHNPHSSTFDLTQTQIIDGRLVRVLSWYDNEWGFANRMSDTAVAMGKFWLIIPDMPDTLSRKTLTDLISEQAVGSVVLVRADLNVPLDDDYKLRDATRLMRILPTLKILSEAG